MADPESKGGSEAGVRVAKADLVPTEANLLEEYQSIGELAEACERFCAEVNGQAHRESGRVPAAALEEEREHLHVLPREPYTAALGKTRTLAVVPSDLAPHGVVSSALMGWSLAIVLGKLSPLQ